LAGIAPIFLGLCSVVTVDFHSAQQPHLLAQKAKPLLSTVLIDISFTGWKRERFECVMNSIKEDNRSEQDQTSRAIQTVLDALQTLRFGSIQLTIHDGRLVQVDVTERSRFTNSG
jgi:hypothetical protein